MVGHVVPCWAMWRHVELSWAGRWAVKVLLAATIISGWGPKRKGPPVNLPSPLVSGRILHEGVHHLLTYRKSRRIRRRLCRRQQRFDTWTLIGTPCRGTSWRFISLILFRWRRFPFYNILRFFFRSVLYRHFTPTLSLCFSFFHQLVLSPFDPALSLLWWPSPLEISHLPSEPLGLITWKCPGPQSSVLRTSST